MTDNSSGALPFDPSRVMQEFYLSRYYEPKAERPADNVRAVIEFVHDTYIEPLEEERQRAFDLGFRAAGGTVIPIGYLLREAKP